MGVINIFANNFIENASGSIVEDGGEIVNLSEAKVVQNGAKGVDYDKNKDRKPPTDIRITKVEGPFDGKGKIVDKIVLGTSYVFKATPTRKPTVTEIALLKWAVKFDNGERLIINGVASLNKLDGDKIIIQLVLKHDFEKARIYAFYQKPDDGVSVELGLNRIIKVNSKLVGKAKRDPGYNFDKTPAEDMTYGNSPIISSSIKKDKIFTYDNAILESYLDQLMESLSVGDMETVALEMSSRFKKGTGGVYKSNILNKEIENNSATLEFHNNFLKKFKNELKLANYDPKMINLTSMDLLNFSSFWDKVSGLGITIHQVWSVKAVIENYSYYESTGKWDCDLVYTFYDHYGLDWDDIIKHGGDRKPQYHTGDCFKAWYILQHYRDAKPFITEMTKKVKISGN
ncbi:DUF3289 family protein [Flavobacterium psychrophilum]|nr:DUF3289 family protein [Flavobacterium psychrophilum]